MNIYPGKVIAPIRLEKLVKIEGLCGNSSQHGPKRQMETSFLKIENIAQLKWTKILLLESVIHKYLIENIVKLIL